MKKSLKSEKPVNRVFRKLSVFYRTQKQTSFFKSTVSKTKNIVLEGSRLVFSCLGARICSKIRFRSLHTGMALKLNFSETDLSIKLILDLFSSLIVSP